MRISVPPPPFISLAALDAAKRPAEIQRDAAPEHEPRGYRHGCCVRRFRDGNGEEGADAPKPGRGPAAGDPVKHSLTFGPPAWGSTSGGSAEQRDCAWPREGPRSQRPSATMPATAGGCGRRTGRSLISFRGIHAPIWRGRCAVGWAGPSRSASARNPRRRGRDEALGLSGLVWTLDPAANVHESDCRGHLIQEAPSRAARSEPGRPGMHFVLRLD
jgi:hypothetical protein